MRVAAAGGHLEALKHFPHELSEVIASAAMRGGHLDVVRWLLEDAGCRVNDEWAVGDMARGGNVEVMKWMRARGAGRWDPFSVRYMLSVARDCGNTAAYDWLNAL